MRAALLIAWREYKQYVLSRGFIAFLIMFPVMLIGIGLTVAVVERSKPVRSFVVYDAAGGYAAAIDKEIGLRVQREVLGAFDIYAQMAIDPEKFDVEKLPAPYAPGAQTHARLVEFEKAGGVAAAKAAIAPYLRRGVPQFDPPHPLFRRLEAVGELASADDVDVAAFVVRPYLLGEAAYPGAPDGLFAALLIPEDYTGDEDGAQAQFWSRNLTDPSLESMVTRALSSTARRRLAEQAGIDMAQLEALADVGAPVKAYRPDKVDGGGETKNIDRLRSAVIPAAMTYMLLVVIFGVGNLLLTNTIEERSNKIVEILLSSVTANQLMLGKLIGIAAVGLTMPAIFLVTGAALGATGLQLGDEQMREITAVLFSSNFLIVYLFYFFCAYVIFAMIFLAIGAVSNSLQDAQSYMGPVMLIVFAPMPFMISVFQNPNGPIASILTWIPIYTPYAVMMRAAADPPIWEIVGATCLMLAFAYFLARAMGRIFRAAILQSSPPKAKDLLRLARTAN